METIKTKEPKATVQKTNTTDKTILSIIRNENQELKEENSNKNTMLASTQRDYIAGEVSRDLTQRVLLPKKIVDAHKEGILHFHDMDYFIQPIHNCCLVNIKDMFEKASCGLVFSREMILRIQPELKKLSSDKPDSFHNLLRLIEILKILSLDEEARKLNAVNTVENFSNIDNDRLDTIMLFLHENYQRPVLLSELASLINMSEASLTRFLKKWTGKTFIDNLNDIRIAEAVCRLIDTSDTIAEICYKSGFNNLSNFNRAFKRRKGNTPTEYREKYARTRFRV